MEMSTLSKVLPNPHPRHYPIHDEILSSKSEIDKIDTQISNLQVQINKLQAQLDSLQHERDNHMSYISIFRCLPVDVLVEIAHQCLQSGTSCKKLMKVSSNLRNVVTGTSTFWNNIRLWSGDYKYGHSVRPI
ncbi:1893_t:CDS:1 [Acaulospora colombiana]|uniref:1893_t:CDS:1 n=1 Tax=Acaulospora colombiana TaxID=27376 RepID=A0ACA9NUG5_9GLOM|nr:1893_t:CDS:1 [Acaulospora colombiana]